MRQLSIVIAALFVMTGCLSLSIDHEIYPGGNSDFVLQYDFSQMMLLVGDVSDNLGSPCDNFQSIQYSCRYESGIIYLSGSIDASQSLVRTNKGLNAYYEYDLDFVFTILMQVDMGDDFNKRDLQVMRSEFASMGIKNPVFNYRVTLPGTIQETPGFGVVDGRTIEVNLFDLADNDNNIVVAKGARSGVMLLLFLLFFTILVLCFVFLYLFVMASHSNKKVVPMPQIHLSDVAVKKQSPKKTTRVKKSSKKVITKSKKNL